MNWVPSGSIFKKKGAPGLHLLLSSRYQVFSDLDQGVPGLTCHQEAQPQPLKVKAECEDCRTKEGSVVRNATAGG